MGGTLILVIFLTTLILFFWGVYKAVKTQKTLYAWAMLPFFLAMGGMFLI